MRAIVAVAAAARPREEGRSLIALSATLAIVVFALVVAGARYLAPCAGRPGPPPATAADSVLDRIAPGLRLPIRVCDAQAVLPGTALARDGSYALRPLPGYLHLTEGLASTRRDAGRRPVGPRALLVDFSFRGSGPFRPLEDTLQEALGSPTLSLCTRRGTLGGTRLLVWHLRDATVSLVVPQDPSERADSLGRLPPSSGFGLMVSAAQDRLPPQLAKPCEWKRPA